MIATATYQNVIDSPERGKLLKVAGDGCDDHTYIGVLIAVAHEQGGISERRERGGGPGPSGGGRGEGVAIQLVALAVTERDGSGSRQQVCGTREGGGDGRGSREIGEMAAREGGSTLDG